MDARAQISPHAFFQSYTTWCFWCFPSTQSIRTKAFCHGQFLSRVIRYALAQIWVVFSAFGRIRTSFRMPVLTAYVPVLAQGILRLPYWATGSSTQAGTGCTDFQLIGSSVANCQALTGPYISPTISWKDTFSA